MTLWEVWRLCAHRPLHRLTDREVEENLAHVYRADGLHTENDAPDVTQELRTLMTRCWTREPEERPTFAEAAAALETMRRETQFS